MFILEPIDRAADNHYREDFPEIAQASMKRHSGPVKAADMRDRASLAHAWVRGAAITLPAFLLLSTSPTTVAAEEQRPVSSVVVPRKSPLDPDYRLSAFFNEATNLIVLNWTPVPKASTYRVLRRKCGKGREIDYQEIAVTQKTTHVDADLTPKMTYYYALQAMFGTLGTNGGALSGEAVVSLPMSMCPDGPPPPAGVEAWINVKVEKGTGKVIYRVRLSWEKATDIENVLTYAIYRSDHPDGKYSMINFAQGNEPFFIDISVDTGRIYYYRVTAMDKKFRESQPSAVAQRFVPRIRR